MNARHYDPGTGRFLSQDTYSGNAYEPWTQHLYSYTSNNPVNFVDPTGHSYIVNETRNGQVGTIAHPINPKRIINYRSSGSKKTSTNSNKTGNTSNTSNNKKNSNSKINNKKDKPKQGVTGIGISVGVHAYPGGNGGKTLYFDKNGGFALMDTSSVSAMNDVELSVSAVVERSNNATSVRDMEGWSAIGGAGIDTGIGIGANYQWAGSTTSPVKSHSISININASLSPVEVNGGMSHNRVIAYYNKYTTEGEFDFRICTVVFNLTEHKFDIRGDRD